MKHSVKTLFIVLAVISMSVSRAEGNGHGSTGKEPNPEKIVKGEGSDKVHTKQLQKSQKGDCMMLGHGTNG